MQLCKLRAATSYCSVREVAVAILYGHVKLQLLKTWQERCAKAELLGLWAIAETSKDDAVKADKDQVLGGEPLR